ncbi:ATP-binding protein [Kordiimonas lipolytica]|uniref:histidine kinase n=1 Tax=Kordiimonas lipolytica TaxID=1662421 RepID=A0ABV8U7F8_9PROT|nr:ATP-binding protein [Kordiimonas lipolytica]
MQNRPKEQLQILNKFARDLMGLSSVEDLIWYVVEEVVGQLGFVDCVIYLHDEKRGTLVQQAAFGEKKGADHSIENKIELKLGAGISGHVALTMKPERIADTRKDQRYVEDLRGMRSELTVPIVYNDKLYGIIDCEHPDVGYFTKDHEDLLTTIASMLAVRLAEWQTHEQLAESEEKYRQLFEMSEDAMMILANNKFELCNQGAATMFEYASPEEMAKAHPSEVSPEYQPCGLTSFEKAEDMMRIAVQEGYTRFEWMHRKKSGEIFPVEVTLTRVPYQGQVALYAICRDISEAKADQAVLQRALAEAEAASKAKSAFLANMSHELRTPLNAIIGMSEIMKDKVFGPIGSAKYEEYSSDIYRSGTFLLQMINDILDLSAIDAAERAMEKAHLDIAEIIADCTVMVSAQANKKRIQIQPDLSKAPSTVWADSRALRQTLINLMSNAVKFGYDGGHVQVQVVNEKERVVFRVSDNGRGIPEDRLATITQRFDRGHLDPTNAVEGTGLGLAIVEQFVTLQGGTLQIESRLGEGTTVTFDLPKERG